MARHLHLFRRNAVYYWRRRLPEDFARTAHKSHLVISLQTRDPTNAKPLARRLSVAFDQYLDRMQSTNRQPTPEDIAEIIRTLRALLTERIELSPIAWANLVPDYEQAAVEQDIEPKTREEVDAEFDAYFEAFEQEARAQPDLYSAQAVTLDFINIHDLRRRWRDALAGKDLWVIGDHLDDALRKLGHTVDPDSLLYRQIATAALKTGIEVLDETITRSSGPNDAEVLPAIPVAPPAAPATIIIEQPRATGMPMLRAGIDRFCEVKGISAWEEKAQRDARVAFRFLLDMFGDVPSHSIRKSHARDFLLALTRIPAHHGKAPFVVQERVRVIEKNETPSHRRRARFLYTPLTMQDLTELAERIEQGLEADDPSFAKFADKTWIEDGEVRRLSFKTQNKYISYAHGLYDFLLEEADLTMRNPFEGIMHPKKIIEREQEDGRCPWQKSDLQKLFDSPIWRGCQSAARRSQPGAEVIRDARYWIPLLGAYAGLRLEEACQLRVDDIAEIEKLPCILVRRSKQKGQGLKNAQSVREVPIHRSLIASGFLDHAAKMRSTGTDWLFPELEPGGPYLLRGYAFSKQFTEYRKAIGLFQPWLDFHALRHSFTTTLKNLRQPGDQISALLGHAREGITSRVYFKGFPVATINETLQALDYEIDIQHITGGAA
jgi:integrase